MMNSVHILTKVGNLLWILSLVCYFLNKTKKVIHNIRFAKKNAKEKFKSLYTKYKYSKIILNNF